MSLQMEHGTDAIDVLLGQTALPHPFNLHHGGSIEKGSVAWAWIGDRRKPITIAFGGNSANRCAVDIKRGDEIVSGWWRDFVKAGGAIDLDETSLICMDYIGGTGESSRPLLAGQLRTEAVVDPRDQAIALEYVLDDLSIRSVDLIIGCSYGGFVAACFAERARVPLKHILTIGAAHFSHPRSIAWRSLQRQIVRFGREAGQADRGLAIARGLAMTTFRTAEEFKQKFCKPPIVRDGAFKYPVEIFLEAWGMDYVRKADPVVLLSMSESSDIFVLDPSRAKVPLTAVAITPDSLVLEEQVEEFASLWGGATEYITMPSVYGHDAFLKEVEQVGRIIRVIRQRL